MKKILLFILSGILSYTAVAQGVTIRVSTDKTDLILKTSHDNRLYQSYFGIKLINDQDVEKLTCFNPRVAADGAAPARAWEVYGGNGCEDFFEAPLHVQHADGNMTTMPKYLSHKVLAQTKDYTHTQIELKDEVYNLYVTLNYVAYNTENVIKSWSEIRHTGKSAVTLLNYASSMLYFERPTYFLTEYSGDWAMEMRPSTQQLQFGKKVIDTKLGSRAAMHAYPFFVLGLGEQPKETSSEVIMGTIGWTGNFRFTFEVDNQGNLRILSGINPHASAYPLASNEVFTTPEFIFTLSDNGIGEASRNLHDWARNFQIKDGKGDRLTLLNNWEATGFKFDQASLSGLMVEAKELGVDMFLLDDGWFANKYPRSDDRAGLGDWGETKSKLPQGIPALVTAAEKAGVKFGIWIEPEMVNPKSELYEKHPEWVIEQPNRDTYYFRNQLVLDLSNPVVQDYVFKVVDDIMTKNPKVAYFKWDCNSPITNIYSPYLKGEQNKLYIEHVRGVYNVFKRVSAKYPNVPMMLCSGGGARCDYEALKYFTEFWPSDNTDPIERLYIQWAFSQFMPTKTLSAHVTSWNKSTSIKFRTDVAMMCKLGFDISLKELDENEKIYCKEAVANYTRLKPTILDGDFYRLVSPFETSHTAVQHVSKDKKSAVLYAFDLFPRYGEKLLPVRLEGLIPTQNYLVQEINLMPDTKSRLKENGKVYSGDFLMKIGLDAQTQSHKSSRIIELIAQ